MRKLPFRSQSFHRLTKVSHSFDGPPFATRRVDLLCQSLGLFSQTIVERAAGIRDLSAHPCVTQSFGCVLGKVVPSAAALPLPFEGLRRRKSCCHCFALVGFFERRRNTFSCKQRSQNLGRRVETAGILKREGVREDARFSSPLLFPFFRCDYGSAHSCRTLTTDRSQM